MAFVSPLKLQRKREVEAMRGAGVVQATRNSWVRRLSTGQVGDGRWRGSVEVTVFRGEKEIRIEVTFSGTHNPEYLYLLIKIYHST